MCTWFPPFEMAWTNDIEETAWNSDESEGYHNEGWGGNDFFSLFLRVFRWWDVSVQKTMEHRPYRGTGGGVTQVTKMGHHTCTCHTCSVITAGFPAPVLFPK
jgi:hypothetical protein